MINDSVLTERKLIISIGEARKIMGKDAEDLSDSQIEKLIADFTSVGKLYFEGTSSNDVSMRNP